VAFLCVLYQVRCWCITHGTFNCKQHSFHKPARPFLSRMISLNICFSACGKYSVDSDKLRLYMHVIIRLNLTAQMSADIFPRLDHSLITFHSFYSLPILQLLHDGRCLHCSVFQASSTFKVGTGSCFARLCACIRAPIHASETVSAISPVLSNFCH